MKQFYYSLLLLGFSFFVTAQTTPTGNSTEVGVTEGQLSVSLSGAATYTIPIAVPPGINGVVPQVGLTYNSQGGNGIAGYGWNISGVSAITRIPRTKFHDGVVGGVNRDFDDRFALDGQRLILKSGTYGMAWAVYETENFSNLKIETYGVTQNPSRFYFKVSYPDGSSAIYDNEGGSGNNLNYLIKSWTNAQGVTITYSYIFDGNSSYIDKIQYGHITGGSPINSIQFNYAARNRSEQSYVGGISYDLNKILSSINVTVNGLGFRNYDLTPEATSLGYTRLKKITEKSGDGIKSYNPTVFSYGVNTNSELFSINPNKPQLSITNINAVNAATVVDDFDGDGKNDFIVYPKTGPDAYKKYWVYNDVYGSRLHLGSNHNIGDFTDIFTTSFLKGDAANGYKLSSSKGWTVAKNNGNNFSFDIYALAPIPASTGYSHYPALEYSKTVSFPTQDIEDCYSTSTVMFPKKILSGDFNGDGLTDVMAVDLPLNTTTCDYDGNSYTNTIYSQNVYFVDLKKDSAVLTTPVGIINEIATDATKIEVIDFNGDGKSDFMVLTEGKVTVYTLGTASDLITLATYSDVGLKADKPCLLGDYNGDGKTDFVIPQIAGQDIWCFYQATGSNAVSGFIKTQKAIGTTYYLNSSTDTEIGGWRTREIDIIEYNYLANDLNGDGKTDIVRLYNKSFDHYDYYSLDFWGNHKYDHSDYTNQGKPINSSVKLFHNLYTAAAGLNFSFQETTISGIHTYPIPLFTNHTQPNLKLEFSLLTNNTIYTFNCNTDNRIDTRLATVTTGNGVVDRITYKPLIYDISESDVSIYTPVVDKSIYPNTDIGVAPGLQVVSMLEKQNDTSTKKQLFAYAGATSNLDGLGFMGFRTTMQTNWFEDDSKIISSISKFDPNLRGANVESYSYLGLISPEIAINNPAPNTPRKSKIIVDNSRTATETLIATNSIRFLPGATITPGAGNNFVAQITPDFDANGFAETNTSLPSNLISKTLSFYETNLSPSKVFKLQNIRSNTYNILENTSTETNIEYDVYNNPTESIAKIRSGGGGQQTTISVVGYDSPIQSPYIVGRVNSKTQTVSVSGDSMNSKEAYEYGSGPKSNLLTKIQKWGNNTSAITETNDYDSFGNITQKIISASGITDRKTSFVYDPTGLYLKESSDIEQFKTAYEYYPNGTLKSEKKQTELNSWSNAHETGYDYDSWFRKKTVTDYLGKTHTYAYLRDSQNNRYSKITLTGDADGSYSEELFDDLGRKIRAGVRDIQNNMSYMDYKYDIYDRNYAVSEPYAGSPSLWTTTTYDVYGYPDSVTDFKRKTVTMLYDKLTTTVTDGSTSQKKKSVKNAMGNVVSMEESPIGGTINYSYFANGNLKETNFNGSKTTITQDGWGRKTSLTDPSAGTYTYEYNALGENTKESTPNGTTTYTLDNWGKIDTKTITGSNTNTKYTYAGDNRLLIKKIFTDTDAGKTITTDYTYDAKKRLETVTETNGYGATFFKKFEYDALGRVSVETSRAELNSKSDTTVVENEYKNGFVYKIYEIKNGQRTKTLWEANEVNARGQLKKVKLGNGINIDNLYDSDDFGYLTNNKLTLSSTSAIVMELGNEFDPQRGNLKSRTNSLFGNVTENFQYDSQDRLTEYPNASGVQETQYYEDDGRIKSNALGAYNYTNSAKTYQNTSITASPDAVAYYQSKLLQTVSYNAFKSPVEIVEDGIDKDKISFVYNDNNDRSVMFYGGLGLKHTRTYQKHYSADGSMEIKKNTSTGEIEFVTYIAGDGYTAPIVYKKNYDILGNTQEQTLYLHRDDLGSIVAITNETGAVVEKRQFDAWGNIVTVQDGNSNTLNGLTILDRGFTGHEHLQSVGLIHMNGRLYDPKLHRFLQPDNYVQDPSNTQNYNRYGYVLNNPLKYTDPSGEYGEFPGGGLGVNPVGNGDAIHETLEYDPVKDWLSRNLSARSFDKFGTEVGKFFRDGTNWVVGGIGKFFGGNRNAPAVNVMSNAEIAQYNSVNTFTNVIANKMNTFINNHYCEVNGTPVFVIPGHWGGVTLPNPFVHGKSFIIAQDFSNRVVDHEGGHADQALELGNRYLYMYKIGLPSMYNCIENNFEVMFYGGLKYSVEHEEYRTEVDANVRAYNNNGGHFKHIERGRGQEPENPLKGSVSKYTALRRLSFYIEDFLRRYDSNAY